MTGEPPPWDGERVRRWLARRYEVARLDQAAADRRGYEARDEYDQAAAEEWMCRALQDDACTDDQKALVQRIKALVAQEDYPATGIHDDMRFERHVRAHLRKLAKMAKANEGFDKLLRYQ